MRVKRRTLVGSALYTAGLALSTLLVLLGVPASSVLPFFFVSIVVILMAEAPLGAAAGLLTVVLCGVLLLLIPPNHKPVPLLTIGILELWFAGTCALVWALAVRLRRTIRTTTQRELQAVQSQHLHRRLLDAAPDALIVVDSAAKMVLVNAQATTIFGYPEEELLGQSVNLLVPPEQQDAHQRLLDTYMTDPQPRLIPRDLSARRKDGSVFPCAISLSVLHPAGGGLLVTAAVRDVSARVAVQQELERTRTQALFSEERFHALLDAAPDPMLVLDDAGHLSFASRQARLFFGFDANSDAILHQDIDRLLPNGRELLRSRVAMGFIPHIQARSIDGTLREVEVSLAPLQVQQSRLITLALRDLEPRRLLAEQQERTRAAEQAVAERDHWLAISSHELKSPMTSLLGYTELLEAALATAALDPPTRARTDRALSAIIKQSRKMARLVEQLLTVTRLTHGRLVLEPVPTNLITLLEEQIAQFQPPTTTSTPTPTPTISKKHTLTLEESLSKTIVVCVDPLRIEQVISNLLSNAIAFSPDGGAILVSVKSSDHIVEIAVRDHGLGVPENKRSALFQRFSQAHNSHYRSGLGLGLFISKQIVELHSGTIRMEFPEDGGTRVVVTLPLDHDETS